MEDKNKDPALAKLLIKYADPNAVDRNGETLAMRAVTHNRPDILQFLADDPRINLLVKNNNFHFRSLAVLSGPQGNDDVIHSSRRNLLASYYSVPIGNIGEDFARGYYEGGCTVLDQAILENKLEMLGILLHSPKSKSALNHSNSHSRTPIMTAINEENLEAVKALMKHNPDIHLI